MVLKFGKNFESGVLNNFSSTNFYSGDLHHVVFEDIKTGSLGVEHDNSLAWITHEAAKAGNTPC